MKDTFIPLETGIPAQLKELKCGIDYIGYYMDNDRFYFTHEITPSVLGLTNYRKYGAPTYDQVLNYLTDFHIDIWVVPVYSEQPKQYKYFMNYRNQIFEGTELTDRKEAFNNAIKRALPLIERKMIK